MSNRTANRIRKQLTTRLYNEFEAFQYWIPSFQEAVLLASGEYEDHFERRGNELRKVGIKPRCHDPEYHESDTALTERDARANVGITGGAPGEPPNQVQQRATMQKVYGWPFASANNHAVTVIPFAAHVPCNIALMRQQADACI